MPDARYASRKFLLACFAMLAALGLLLAGRIDPDAWASFCTWVLGLYMTGNVSAAYVARATGKDGSN